MNARKRVFDVVVGSVLALLALPVIVGLALAVALTFRAWPFFVQDRIGLGGRPFRMVKLRTLRPATHPYVLKDDLPPDAAPAFGRFLRRWHLDELPQLLLVPGGRLSLVGPRPKMPDRFEPVDPVYAERRIQVPQGCTGLWQVCVHRDELPSASPQYDLFYVEHRSLRLDLWILWRTALLLLGIAPRVTLDDVPAWAAFPIAVVNDPPMAEAPGVSGRAA